MYVKIFSHLQGEVMRSVLTYDPVKGCLELQPTERSYLGFLTHSVKVRIFIFIKTKRKRCFVKGEKSLIF